MKNIERIIGYLEGRLEELKKKDPEPPTVYFIEELLRYIKEK